MRPKFPFAYLGTPLGYCLQFSGIIAGQHLQYLESQFQHNSEGLCVLSHPNIPLLREQTLPYKQTKLSSMYPISKPSTTRQQSSLNMLNFSLRSFMPRSLVVLGGVSFALLSLPNGVNAFISLPVTRNGHGRETYPTHLMRRDTGTWEQMMNNNISGGGYYAQVQVGTPPQDVTLIVDTGSSDVWVLDTNADLCTSPLKQQQSQVGGCIETCKLHFICLYDSLLETDKLLISATSAMVLLVIWQCAFLHFQR